MSIAKILSYCFLGVFPVFQIGCYRILQQKKDDMAIRKRNVTMIYISTIAAWLAYINLVNSLFGGIPCAIYHVFVIMIPPLSIGTQLLRGLRLWGMLTRNKILSQSYGNNMNNDSVDRVGADDQLTIIHEVDSSKGEHSQMSDVHMHVRKSSSIDNQVMNSKIKLTRIVGLVRLVLVIFPLTLICGLFVMTDAKQLGEQTFLQCFPEPSFLINGGRVLAGALSLAAFGTTIFMSKKEYQDGLGIRMEIVRNIAILFVTNLLGFFLRLLGSTQWYVLIYVIQQMILSLSMTVMPCLSNASVLTWVKSTGYFKKLIPGYARPLPQLPSKRSSLVLNGKRMSQMESTKREREATMSLDAGLCILLSSNDGIDSFTEHCAKEFSVENLRFWLEVNEFHKAVDNVQEIKANSCYNQKDLLTFAQEIYSTFIEEGSNLQINISEAQLVSIRNKLSSEEEVQRDLFDSAQREVYSLMSRHSYPRFLASYKSKATGETKLEKRFTRRNSTILPI